MISNIATKKKKPIIFGIKTTIIGILMLSCLTGCITREPSEQEIADAVMTSLKSGGSDIPSMIQDLMIKNIIDKESIKKNYCEKNSDGDSYMCDTSIKVIALSKTFPVRMEKDKDGWNADIHWLD